MPWFPAPGAFAFTNIFSVHLPYPMIVIQQAVEIDETRRVLRLEKPLPASIGSRQAYIRFTITRDAAGLDQFEKPKSVEPQLAEPFPSIVDCKQEAAEKRRRRAEGRTLFEGLGESLKNSPPFFHWINY
jgi:hypothetical protein